MSFSWGTPNQVYPETLVFATPPMRNLHFCSSRVPKPPGEIQSSSSGSNNSGDPRGGLGEPWAAFGASWGLLGAFEGPFFALFSVIFAFLTFYCRKSHFRTNFARFSTIFCDFSLKSAIFHQFSLQNAREIHHKFRAAVVRKFRLVQCADTRFDCEKPVCERCPLDCSLCCAKQKFMKTHTQNACETIARREFQHNIVFVRFGCHFG